MERGSRRRDHGSDCVELDQVRPNSSRNLSLIDSFFLRSGSSRPTGAEKSGDTGSSSKHGSMTSGTPLNNQGISSWTQSSEEVGRLSLAASKASPSSHPSSLPHRQFETGPNYEPSESLLDPRLTATTSPTLPPADTASLQELSISGTFTGARNFGMKSVEIVHAAGNVERNTNYTINLFSFGTCSPRFVLDYASSDHD